MDRDRGCILMIGGEDAGFFGSEGGEERDYPQKHGYI